MVKIPRNIIFIIYFRLIFDRFIKNIHKNTFKNIVCKFTKKNQMSSQKELIDSSITYDQSVIEKEFVIFDNDAICRKDISRYKFSIFFSVFLFLKNSFSFN